MCGCVRLVYMSKHACTQSLIITQARPTMPVGIRGISRSNARAVPLLHAESRHVSPACSREHIMEPIVGLS